MRSRLRRDSLDEPQNSAAGGSIRYIIRPAEMRLFYSVGQMPSINFVRYRWLLAVTVLTSFSDADALEVGFQGRVLDEVLRLTSLARAAGCDGIVTSAREASLPSMSRSATR